MTYKYGVQTIDTYDNGKHIIKSGAVGSTNVDEIEWLTAKLVELSKPWKKSGWGYVVDISGMAPVTPDVSQMLVDMHIRLAEAGCKAMAFVNFASFITGFQAKEHHKKSQTGIYEAQFKSEQDALKWIDSIME